MSMRDFATVDRGVKAALLGIIGCLALMAIVVSVMSGSWWTLIIAVWILVDLYLSSMRVAARDERAERIELMASHLCRQLTILVVLIVWVMTLTEPRPLRPSVWPMIVLLTLFAPARAIKWYLGLREEDEAGMAAKVHRVLGAVSSALILIMIVFLLQLSGDWREGLGLGLKDMFFVIERPATTSPVVGEADGDTAPKIKGRTIRLVPLTKKK